MELTRRHVLTGAAGIAAAPLLPALPADAAAPVADKQAPSFYRYKVGDAQVTAISDGVNNFALPDTFVLNVKKDEVNAALEKNFMLKDKHPKKCAFIGCIGTDEKGQVLQKELEEAGVHGHFHKD